MSGFLPPRKSRANISLTPLVDVIFLLLIFFMLTSQIAPFSIFSFSKAKIENDIDQLNIPRISEENPVNFGALISVFKGGVSINGKQVANSKLVQELAALRQAGNNAVVISPKSTSSVQDLITVLEAVKRASFKTVKIRRSKR